MVRNANKSQIMNLISLKFDNFKIWQVKHTKEFTPKKTYNVAIMLSNKPFKLNTKLKVLNLN
jgi:hypothetical protein